MIKYKIIFLFIFVHIVSVKAQRTIHGTVFAQNDSIVLAGAKVSCISGSATTGSSVSDDKGQFQLMLPPATDVCIEITHIGYAPYILSISADKPSEMDLGAIYLKQRDWELDEVTVSANRNRIDKALIVPSKNDVKMSEDIYGLLLALNLRDMQIDILNKKVTVGGHKPQWKINGVPKEESEISNIRPQDVIRIEYSDMASVREMDKDYGGVINIIRREQEEGTAISANANTAFATGFVNGGLQASYHKGKDDFSVNYSVSYRHYSKWKKDESSLFISPGDTISRDIAGIESRFGYVSQNINLGYTHFFAPGTSLSVSMRNPIYYQHNIPRSVLNGSVHREVNSSYSGYTPSVDIFFGTDLKNNDRIEINAVGTYGLRGHSQYTMRDEHNGSVTDTYRMPADTKRRSLIWEAFYLHHMGQHRIKAGVQNTLGKSVNRYYEPAYIKDELSENNTYAYAQVDGPVGKIRYSLGTGLKYNVMDNGEKREYWKNRSQLVLSYSASSDLFLRYDAVYYPTMPTLYSLTSVVQRMDDLQLLTGNPGLKSTQNIYNGFLVSFSKKNFSSDLQITYQYSDMPVFMHIEYDKSQQLFVNKYINGIYDSQLDINYSASLKNIFGFMNIFGDIGYGHYRARTENHTNTLGNIYWNLTVQLYYNKFTLSAYLMQPRKSLHNEIISRDEKISRVMLMWKRNNFTLMAAVFNPFTPHGSNYIDESLSACNPSTSKVSIHDNGNMFTIGASWYLNFGKRSQKSPRSLNNYDNNNSILRTNQ